MTTKPISPSEVTKAKRTSVPPAVFEVFNELITENFVRNSASVKQKDVVERLVKRGLDRNEIFRRGWLDVEPVYREEGWHVEYDKPAYNETYDAYFVFSIK